MNLPKSSPRGRGILLAVTPFAIATAVLVYLLFDQRGWRPMDVALEAVLVAICLCLVLTIANARLFWWAPRVIAFIVFAAYLSYLVYELGFSGQPVFAAGRRGAANPLNAILGFCIIGIPCLLYAIRGPAPSLEPQGYWFKSTSLEIEPGEDEDINPGIYGRQLAAWLKARLEDHGYPVEVIEEDWGRCLMCARKPFMLWVGCGAMTGATKEDVVWHCFVVAEPGLLSRFFMKTEAAGAVAKLDYTLGEILRAEPTATLVDAP
jgi:hypothetical protein